MKYEIVEYANELNDLNLSSFNLIDKRIFFSILSQCKNQPAGKNIVMKKEDLIRLGIYPERKRVTLKQFARDLGRVVGLCYSMYFHKLEETDEELWIRNIRLFDQIDIKINKKNPEDLGKIELHFKIEAKAKDFLDTVLPFTSFPLREYQSLKSVYAQDLFIHLKQFKNKGKYFVKASSFRKYLNIPDSYRQCDIDRRILAEAIKELTPFFPNLRYVKVRDENDRRRVGRYEFYWDVPTKVSKQTNNGKYSIANKNQLPSWLDLNNFKNEINTDLDTTTMMAILLKKIEKEPISSWKAYLKGAVDNINNEKAKNKNSLPEWWNLSSTEEDPTPDLLLEVIVFQKSLLARRKGLTLMDFIEEIMEKSNEDRDTVIKAIEAYRKKFDIHDV